MTGSSQLGDDELPLNHKWNFSIGAKPRSVSSTSWVICAVGTMELLLLG